MARIEIIIAKLPVLIADRSDSLKLETAIRYIGDIIFDASQDSKGEKAAGLMKVLSQPSTPTEAESREAILTLFRDGYLDRYAEYSAWKHIARAAGTSLDPRIDPFSQNATLLDAPKVISITKVLNTPPVSAKGAGAHDSHAGLANPLKPSLPIPRSNGQTQRLDSKEERTSKEPARTWIEQNNRNSRKSDRKAPQQSGSDDGATNRTESATAFLEITSLEATDRSPVVFASKFQKDRANHLFGKTAPCLIGFVPKIAADRFVEWTNPVTADSFRDHGRRLKSSSPSRLAIRAMFELARADNWTTVSVKGSVRLQAFAEATAAELDRSLPLSAEQNISDDSVDIRRPAAPGSKNKMADNLCSLGIATYIGCGIQCSLCLLESCSAEPARTNQTYR